VEMMIYNARRQRTPATTRELKKQWASSAPSKRPPDQHFKAL